MLDNPLNEAISFYEGLVSGSMLEKETKNQ